MSVTEEIRMHPIGFVRRRNGEEIRDKRAVCSVILEEALSEALDGVEGFSHLFIIYWMHKVPAGERGMLKAHPRGRKDMPLLGVLATRVARRPNPIGLTLVELVERRGNVLTITGLDAVDGTPVLDIKPFDYWDMTEDAKVPEWWMRLEAERKIHRRSAGNDCSL